MPLITKSPTVLLHFNEVPVGSKNDIVPTGTTFKGPAITSIINQTLAGIRNQTFQLDNNVYSLDISSFNISNSFTLKYAEYLTGIGDLSSDITISNGATPGVAGITMNYDSSNTYCLYVSSNGTSWNLVSGQTLVPEVANVWNQYELSYDAETKNMYYFKNGELIVNLTLAANPYYDPNSDHKYVYINWAAGKGSRKGYMKNFDFIAGTCLHKETFVPDTIDQSTVCTLKYSPYITTEMKALGEASLKLTGSDYIDLPNNILNTSNDFTISYREYVTALTTNSSAAFYMNCETPISMGGGLLVGYSDGTNRRIYACSSVYGNWDLISAGSLGPIELNVWNTWEIGYKDSTKTLYVFKNGTLVNSFVLSARIGSGATGKCAIGAWADCMQGYIDEFMILNGKCLHTSNFTVPTDEYTCDTYYLVKTRDGKFYSINTNGLTEVGVITDQAAIATLFKTKGSYVAATDDQLVALNNGSNNPINACWQGTVGEDLPSSTIIGAPIKAQFVYMNSDFQLTKMSNLDWFKVNNGTVNAETGTGKIRHIVSRDSGKTWYAYDKVNEVWKQVIDMSSSSTVDGEIDANGKFVLNNTTIINVLTNGMAAADFASVPWNAWTLADGYKTIRFACVLCIESTSDKAMLDNIQYQFDGMGKWKLAANRTDYEVATDNTSHAIKWLSGLNGMRVKVNY